VEKFAKTKAILVGIGSYVVLAALLVAVLVPVFVLLGLLSYSFTSWHVTHSHDPFRWDSLLFPPLLAFAAGYLAASRVRSGKLLVGLFLGLPIAAFAPLCFWWQLRSLPMPSWLYVVGPQWALITTSALKFGFTVLGAFLEGRIRRQDAPLPIKRWLRLATAYTALLGGLALSIGTGLVLFLRSRNLELAREADVMVTYPIRLSDLDPTQALFLAGIALLFLLPIAYGVVTLVAVRGFKRGLWKNPLVYGTLCLVALGGGLVVIRDRQNQPDLSVIDTVADEINASNAIEPTENGALLYQEAIEALSDDPMPLELHNAGLWTRKDHPDWAAWLAKNKRAFELALEGSRKKSIYFTIVPDKDEMLRHEHLLGDWGQRQISDLRDLLQGLCALARSQAGEGNVTGALASLDAVFRAGTSMPKRALGGLSAGRGLRYVAIAGLHDIVLMPNASNKDLEAVQALLQTWKSAEFVTPNYWKARAKAAVLVETELELASMRMFSLSTYAVALLLPRETVRRYTLTVWNEAIEPGSIRKMYERLEEESDAAARTAFTRSFAGLPEKPHDPLRQFVELRYTPRLSYGLQGILCQDAQLNILGACLATARYKNDSAHLPDTWDDLVPKYLAQIPIDPFTGDPLKLKREDGALLIYSVGADGEDDGGACENFLHSGDYPGEDIALRFPPEPKTGEESDEGE